MQLNLGILCCCFSFITYGLIIIEAIKSYLTNMPAKPTSTKAPAARQLAP